MGLRTLAPGDRLQGLKCTLTLKEQLGAGGSGLTFLATVQEAGPDPVPDLCPGAKVVVKAPRITSTKITERIHEELGKLFTKQRIERDAARVLRDLPCVAAVFDAADYRVLGAPPDSDPLPIVIQQYIPGTMLSTFLSRRPGETRAFRGVRDAKTFFFWARLIVGIVHRVHQKQIVHGDVWQDNFIVREDNPSDLVLIDFGQAAFREDLARGGRVGGSWMPKGGSGSIAADVFSLGGLLLYVAAGDFLKSDERPPRLSASDTKKYVVRRIAKTNAALLDSNWGIADIVARCLRREVQLRPQSATAILHDIELFDPQDPPQNKIQPLIDALENAKKLNPMILALASHGINRLSDQIVDLTQGVLDMKAGREDFIVGLTQVIALLGKGDRYLTVSTPAFWRSSNIGSQGRFLSANRQAVLHRGAFIRRLFLVTREEMKDDPDFKKVIDGQISIEDDVKSKLYPDAGDYQARYQIVTASERERLVREGMNFGVLLKQDKKLLLSLDYSDESITAVEFRENPRLAEKFEGLFSDRFEAGRPLKELNRFDKTLRRP